MSRRHRKALPLEFHDPAFAHFAVETLGEDDVLSGDPVARHAPLQRAGDGTSVGLRDYSAGRFRRHYPSDEVVHVVEGEGGVIDENHRVWSLRAGDTVTFRQGTEALWQVREYLRVLSVTCPVRKPPLARRALQAMGTASVAIAGLTLIGVTTIATVAASMMGS
jgi:hypothetical protein